MPFLSDMQFEILNVRQRGLLPVVKLFRKEFYLVGDTAIALQIGHRRSIDFDLFTPKPFGSRRILNVLEQAGKKVNITRRVSEQLNVADIDYTEPVEFMPGYAVEPEKVRALLIDKALEGIL